MTWYHKDERIGTDDDLLEWAYSGNGETQEELKADFEESINLEFTAIKMLRMCEEYDNVTYEELFKDWVFDFVGIVCEFPEKYNIEWRDEE